MAEDTSIQQGPPKPAPEALEVLPVAPPPRGIDAWELAGVMIVGYVPPLLGSVARFTQDVSYLDTARFLYYMCIAATVAVLVRRSAWIAVVFYVLFEGLSRYGEHQGALGFHLMDHTSRQVVTMIGHNLATVVAILGLTVRAPGGWSELGLRLPDRPEQWLIDLALGVMMFFAVRVAWLMLVSVWHAGEYGLHWPMPAGTEPFGGWFLATILFALVSAKEELLRGYMISRFETLARSNKKTGDSFAPTMFAILASAFLFGLWHAAPGSSGSLNVIYNLQCGLLWGVAFAATRRLTANFLSHWMINLGPDRLLRLLVT